MVAKRNLIRSVHTFTYQDLKTSPVEWFKVVLIESFLNFLRENFIKLGYINSIREEGREDKFGTTCVLNMFIFTPADFIEFLEDWDRGTIAERMRLLKVLKSYRGEAWQSTYNYPNEALPTFRQYYDQAVNQRINLTRTAADNHTIPMMVPNPSYPSHAVGCHIFRFDELPEEEQQSYRNKAAALIPEDILVCTRDWSAWNVGTMSSNDFDHATQHDDFVTNIATALYNATIK